MSRSKPAENIPCKKKQKTYQQGLERVGAGACCPSILKLAIAACPSGPIMVSARFAVGASRLPATG
jgi:hypothetical protein